MLAPDVLESALSRSEGEKMTVTGKMNRRHKAALCATLICVGSVVLMGGTVRIAVGLGLLGIAFSWSVGSDTRAVHWVFVATGVILLVAPVWAAVAWPNEKQELISIQNQVIQNDRLMVSSETSALTQASSATERKQAIAAQDKASIDLSRDSAQLHHLRSETIFHHTMQTEWQPLAGGVLLLVTGVGLLMGIKRPRSV